MDNKKGRIYAAYGVSQTPNSYKLREGTFLFPLINHSSFIKTCEVFRLTPVSLLYSSHHSAAMESHILFP